MASIAAAQPELCRLRREIARIEGRLAEADRLALDGAPAEAARSARGATSGRTAGETSGGIGKGGRLRLGFSGLDRILGGGLPLAALHEIRVRECRDGGAAIGFALALVARLAEAGGASSVLWISEAESRREAGRLYAPGLLALGLDPARVIEVAARTKAEALWAFEAALVCRGLQAAVCELRQASLDLSATRRCALRAHEAGVTGFLLRFGGRAEPSAAELRFRVKPVPAGRIGRFAAGVGRMTWQVALEKNRGGRTGVFTMEWNAHERCFAERGSGREERERAHSQPLAAAPFHRPPAAAEGIGAARPPEIRRIS